jgi:uncharacterized protein
VPVKPSEKEEAYFARLELERRKKHEEARREHMAAQERKRLRALHHMRCPKCGLKLSEIDYKGIKVDRCLSCDGIWLDAGELEAISALQKATLVRFFGIFTR